MSVTSSGFFCFGIFSIASSKVILDSITTFFVSCKRWGLRCCTFESPTTITISLFSVESLDLVNGAGAGANAGAGAGFGAGAGAGAGFGAGAGAGAIVGAGAGPVELARSFSRRLTSSSWCAAFSVSFFLRPSFTSVTMLLISGISVVTMRSTT